MKWLISTLLDLVPIVGTVKNAGEAIEAFQHGETASGVGKTIQATIGGVMDVATFGAASVVQAAAVKGMKRVGAELLAKKLAKEVGANVSTRAAGFVATKTVDLASRIVVTIAQLDQERVQRRRTEEAEAKAAEAAQAEAAKAKSAKAEAAKAAAKAANAEAEARRSVIAVLAVIAVIAVITVITVVANVSQGAKQNKAKQNKAKPTAAVGSAATQTVAPAPRSVVTVSLLHQERVRRQGPETADTVEKEPAKRGEHVINNNVLKFYRSVIEEFISRSMPGQNFQDLVDRGLITPDMQVYQAYYNPLDSFYTQAVRYELVVKVPSTYQDANAIIYGRRIQRLRGATVTYMMTISSDSSHSSLPKVERHIIDEVEEFLAGGYFVDQQALNIWFRKGGKRAKYEDVKGEVEQMFRRLEYHDGNDEVIQWVREIRQAVKRDFRNTLL